MVKIFLVDDDIDLSLLTKKVFVKEGYDVLTFNEASKAIEEAGKQRPDLILMDVMLPGMDGAEAIRMLKRDPALNSIPVIFLTGLVSTAEKSEQGEGIHIDGVSYKTVGKPYEVDELIEIVKNAIRRM